MLAGASGLVAFVVVVAIPLLWAWWRAPRFGKELTPITDGGTQPIQFRPGPPPLPEHDADSPLAALEALLGSPRAGRRAARGRVTS